MNAPKKTARSVKLQNAQATVLQAIRAASGGRTTVSIEVAGQLLGIGKDAAYSAVRAGRLQTIAVAPTRLRVPVVIIEKLLLGE